MGYGPDKAFNVFYWPRNPKPGEYGVRVAMVAASDRAEASFKFQRQYKGEYFTIDRIEEC